MSLDGKSLDAIFRRIDENLASPGTICLIGSGATILLGQVARQTEDIDVWAKACRVAMGEFRRAVEAAGVGFDPKDEFPSLPYLQLVHPGIVQVPGWDAERREWLGEAEREVWHGTNLLVTVPPPRVLAASKLVRGSDRDLEDCLWLMAAHGLEAREILAAIRTMPRDPRKKAAENLDVLGMLQG